MKTTESAEMYLETILLLQEKHPQVRSIDIVHQTGYTKPSVSRAVGLLKQRNLINVDENGYITLTLEGKALAAKILERHRIITDFLIGLGVSPEVADEDACKMEHIISDEVFNRIKEHLK
jgi:Mn-dependent DtxR family transcriptional regulator